MPGHTQRCHASSSSSHQPENGGPEDTGLADQEETAGSTRNQLSLSIQQHAESGGPELLPKNATAEQNYTPFRDLVDREKQDISHAEEGRVDGDTLASSSLSSRQPSLGEHRGPDQDSLSSFSEDDGEQGGLYDFAEELRTNNPPTEPWFLEMSRLRRLYILWLNKRQALMRKKILEGKRASDQDMEEVGRILHLQGKLCSVIGVADSLTFEPY